MIKIIASLIPILPLIAALWIALTYIAGFNRGERGERHTTRIALSSAVLSLLLLLYLDGQAMLHGAPGQTVIGRWFDSGDLVIHISFALDILGLGIGTLVAAICVLVLRFSVNYLHREAGFQRFFMVMCLFMASMLTIVLAGNAVLTFVGWELAGVSSYLLIAYAYERPVAAKNAGRAFVTNRIGDAGFILGVSFMITWIGTTDWSSLQSGLGQLTSLKIGLLASGFLLAAFAKSALVPFSPWITRALEGPTSSSAVFYGSLMVHAGVFLLLRIEPLIEAVTALQVLLLLIGVITALYGFLGGLVQTDVKTALMFSTTGQVGLMVVECGLGAFELATWHLAAHAAWRAYQFLNAPSFMQLTSRPARPVPDWLSRRHTLYNTCLNRFWLDNLANGLLTRPTLALAREVRIFDEQVVNRVVGLPAHIGAISSAAEWEARKQGYVSVPEGGMTRGLGALGALMGGIASALHWFEEQLVLKGSGEGLLKTIERIGYYLLNVERLLSQPRYLWLLILATFIVII